MAMTDNMIAGYIAQNLRQLRQSRNLTQEQLARLSGVPRPTWSNLESGAANPTVADWRRQIPDWTRLAAARPKAARAVPGSGYGSASIAGGSARCSLRSCYPS